MKDGSAQAADTPPATQQQATAQRVEPPTIDVQARDKTPQ
jgi:hypothetical protein